MTDLEKLELKRKVARAIYEEQRARCIALSRQGHWTLSGGFAVRPMTARDLAELDELVPAVVRGGRLKDSDYALLLWHMRYQPRGYRWKWLERRAQKRFAYDVSLWLACSDLAKDVGEWLDMQCQDIGGGSGSGKGGKEFASAAIVLATRAAGSGNPVDLLDVPLITIGQILKIRDAQDGVPVGNKSDELITPEILQ